MSGESKKNKRVNHWSDDNLINLYHNQSHQIEIYLMMCKNQHGRPSVLSLMEDLKQEK
jgi:hypothetical protein